MVCVFTDDGRCADTLLELVTLGALPGAPLTADSPLTDDIIISSNHERYRQAMLITHLAVISRLEKQ
tara:strand:- start:824 stop:1024 length:201 start_codon:yes stop_codon:yes gene_type:complete